MNETVDDLQTVPDSNTLIDNLKMVFPNKSGLQLISRKHAVKEGTFAAEVLTCRFLDNPDITIRCKYSFGNENNQEGGHRGGIAYESKVYEELLHGLNLPIAQYYGNFYIQKSHIFCMVLEYLQGSIRVNKTSDISAIVDAAEWIGFFHSCYDNISNSSIKRYDEIYYLQWCNNVKNIGQGLGVDYWLNHVCSYFAKNVHYLLDSSQTLIHGEFYPNNILYKDGKIFPVDWESAALAPGEIDLAGLIEGCGDEFSSKMVKRYLQARYQNSNSMNMDEFMHRLNIAKLYLIFRWVGKYPDHAMWKSNPAKYNILLKSLEKLHDFACKLGLLKMV